VLDTSEYLWSYPMSDKQKLQRIFHAIIPHSTELNILLRLVGDGWALPSHEAEHAFFPVVGPLNKGIKEQLGITVIMLRCLKLVVDREVKRRIDAICCMENRSPDWTPPGSMRWVSREELAGLRLAAEWQRPVIEAWFAETERGTIPPRRAPWAVHGWYDAATEWVQSQLVEHGVMPAGPPEQVKQWDISSILRAHTNDGDYYLKVGNSLFAHEPVITQALARMFPGQVSGPMAVLMEPEQGWMLLRDFGGHVLGEGTATQLEDVLRLHASIQIGCVERVDELLAARLPDRRLKVLAAQVDEVLADPNSLDGITDEEIAKLRAAAPQIKAMCAQLESYGVPQTLLHGDFHGGNIIVQEGKCLIFDWADACIAHPFFDLFIVPDGKGNEAMTPEESDRLRDIYLEFWTEYAPMDQLREAARLARILGAFHQAISYMQGTDSLEDSARWVFAGVAARWLRRVLASL
jgi:predicted transcriptional regulator